MTFSIVARCQQSAMFGVAIASSSPAVAARCAHARSGIGAVATQNITDPALGPYILDALGRGQQAGAALQEGLNSTQFGAYRQLLVLGAQGPAVMHTGARALGLAGSALGDNCAAAGNLLAHEDVPGAMTTAFAAAGGHFGARLLAALRAGGERGGEAGPVHSAGLLIVREVAWPIVDLRVDWSDGDPIAELGNLWRIYAPQIDDYVRRAVDPARAPSFGVPGMQAAPRA
jgi:uncharacterized Ntn-hydrolase superfamily protein